MLLTVSKPQSQLHTHSNLEQCLGMYKTCWSSRPVSSDQGNVLWRHGAIVQQFLISFDCKVCGLIPYTIYDQYGIVLTGSSFPWQVSTSKLGNHAVHLVICIADLLQLHISLDMYHWLRIRSACHIPYAFYGQVTTAHAFKPWTVFGNV
jgi:hypothetical protein